MSQCDALDTRSTTDISVPVLPPTSTYLITCIHVSPVGMISRGYRISKTCSHLGTTSVGRPGVYIERMGPRKSVDEKPKFPQKDFLQAKQAVKMSSLSVSCTNKISDAKLCKRNAVLRMNWLNSRREARTLNLEISLNTRRFLKVSRASQLCQPGYLGTRLFTIEP